MRRGAKAILITVILVVAALTAAASYFLYAFYVPDEQAEVVGNIRYTDAEIRRMAMPGFKEHNSLYLRFLRNQIDLTEMPYIDSVEVEYLGPGRVRLHANEEYPVGYILHDGCRYYFNASGVVTEKLEDTALQQEETAVPDAVGKSETAGVNNTALQPVSVAANGRADAEIDTSFRPALSDVSQVTGLPDKEYAIGEQIQTEHAELFRTLMDLEKLCNKLNIRPDEIRIRNGQKFTLRYREVLVKIGTDTLLDEKMSRAAAILPQLEGMRGILHLENFSPATINIIFGTNEEDTEEEEEAAAEAAAAEEAAAERAAAEEAAAELAAAEQVTGEQAADQAAADQAAEKAAEQAAAEQAAAELAAAEGTGNPGAAEKPEGTENTGETGNTGGTGSAADTGYGGNTGTEEIAWDETWDAVWGAGNEAAESG